MDRAADLLQAIERLYAAVAAPEQWTSALEAIVDLVSGGHAFIDVHGAERPSAAFAASAYLDARDLARASDPDTMHLAMPFMSRIPLGISTRSEIISDANFAGSPVYNELVRSLNGFYSLHIRQNGGSGYLLTLCRPQRAANFEVADMAMLRAIAPHLTTAIGLQQRLHVSVQGYASLAGVLDRIAGGVILTDAVGRPLFANTQAARIANEADGLMLDDGGLGAASAATTRQLRDAIVAVSRDAAIEGFRIRVERLSHRLPLLLTVLPVWRLGVTVPGAGAARAAIFVTEPDVPPPIDRLAVAELFRLTPRESEVAAMLATGLDLATIAARLGLGLGTVRDHLKHVFDKTGARSQVALVALLRSCVDRT